MAFSVSESGGDVTILAIGTAFNTCPKEVTATTPITQSANAQTCKIVIPNLNSDATIRFNGIESFITWADAKSTDGVYAIISNGLPVAYANATSASYVGVAIVMYGRALQISNTWLLAGQKWGSKSVNISGIKDVTSPGGGVTGSGGYLPQVNGSYGTTEESKKIKVGYENWPNYSSTALADTCGWKNTEALITAQGSSYLGGTTTTFRNGSENQGYKDWFIPTVAQLAYMYLHLTEINALLTKCGGRSFPSSYLWTSDEFNSDYAWDVYFSNGYVDYQLKTNQYGYVRFCRDITE